MGLIREVENDTLRILENGNLLFSMQEVYAPEAVTITLSGSMRSDIVFDFQDELMSLALMGLNLILDFSSVNYISSSCMKSLLTIQQKMDSRKVGTLLLKRMPKKIYNEFEKTAASELLLIE